MPYGNLLADVVQGSVANTPPAFRDGNGTQVGTLCRAWVNFNGTGTIAIRASFNVSSITDDGTGLYTVNFTTAMPDDNYSTLVTANQTTGNTVLNIASGIRDTGTSASPNGANVYTTSAVQVANQASDGIERDLPNMMVAIFK